MTCRTFRSAFQKNRLRGCRSQLTLTAIRQSRSGRAFSIAHRDHVNAPMIPGALGVIEIGLNALQIPHRKGGTQAAIAYLGQNVSG